MSQSGAPVADALKNSSEATIAPAIRGKAECMSLYMPTMATTCSGSSRKRKAKKEEDPCYGPSSFFSTVSND